MYFLGCAKSGCDRTPIVIHLRLRGTFVKSLLKTFLLGASCLAIAGSANAANLIVNGGFNNGGSVAAPGGTFAEQGVGSNAITGWSILSGNVDWIKGYWQSADGDGFSVDLNGSAPGAIGQTISTTAGQSYTLTFSLSGNPDAFQNQPRIAVIGEDGATLGNASYSLSGANSRSNMLWSSYQMYFTANSATTQISFTSGNAGNNCCYGAAIDNVAVTAGVPEPATWALMLVGFGGLGAALRSRRSRPVAA